MSKYTKLMNNPKSFFLDSKLSGMFVKEDYKKLFDLNKENWNESKKLAICFGFNPWKRAYFEEYFPDYKLAFVRGKTASFRVLSALESIKEEYKVFIWSYQEKKDIYKYLIDNNIEIHRVEDGFIRSVGLGSDKTKPLSLVIDNDGLYFNPQVESKLEQIIFANAGKYTTQQLDKAQQLIDKIVEEKISKYNLPRSSNENLSHLLIEDKKTILVVGQVEDDMSIKLGYDGKITNLQLLKTAKQENPQATILFKPHPDILKGNRENTTGIKDYEKFSQIVPEGVSLDALLDVSDHVYTITSLSGFEALLRGKKVTCLGSPFYAHWGLTDDRQDNEYIQRRKKTKLSLQELFYATYIQYPTYIYGSIEKTLEELKHLHYDYHKMHLQNTHLAVMGDDFSNITDIDDVIREVEGKKVAFITDSSDIVHHVPVLKKHVEHMDILTAKGNIELQILNKIPESTMEEIRLLTLNKLYFEPMSDIERRSVILAEKLSSSFRDVMDEMLSNVFINKAERDMLTAALFEGLSDNLFQPALSYETLRQALNDYEKIVINIRHDDASSSLLVSFLEVARKLEMQSKIVYVIKNNFETTKERNIEIEKMFHPKHLFNWMKRAKLNKRDRILSLKTAFGSLWLDLIYKSGCEGYPKYQDHAVVSGFIAKRHYGYYLAVKESMDILSEDGKNMVFLPSSLLAPTQYEENKAILFEDLQSGTSVYNVDTGIEFYSEKYKPFIQLFNKKITNDLIEELVIRLNHTLPNEIMNMFIVRIMNYQKKLHYKFLLLNDIFTVMKNASLFLSAMDRSEISRFATFVAKKNNIRNIGIQTMLISQNYRYRMPVVDEMGAIDNKQKEALIASGYNENNINLVGSSNFRTRLKYIQEMDVSIIENVLSKEMLNVFFPMQHSSEKIMLIILELMLELLEQYDFNFIIKPHPYQEKFLIDMFEQRCARYDNITILTKEDDTYAYLKGTDLIVGHTSNVLLEAMLADKDVLIADLIEIDESADLTQLDLSYNAHTEDEFKKLFEQIVTQSPLNQEVRDKRDAYIQSHMYLLEDDKLRDYLLKKEENTHDK